MLLDNHSDVTIFNGHHLVDMIGFEGSTADLDRRAPVTASSRMTVHVVSEDSTQRAAMARVVFAAGQHAEVYADAAEIVAHGPVGGLALVHESGSLGAAQLCRELSAKGLWLPVIGFAAEVDTDRIVAGMKAGAMDFLVGPLTISALLGKLKACSNEAESVALSRARRVEARAVLARLSEREHQVLALLVTGCSNKEMARKLSISPRTVEIHRMKMMAKIGAASGAHATRIWMEASAD